MQNSSEMARLQLHKDVAPILNRFDDYCGEMIERLRSTLPGQACLSLNALVRQGGNMTLSPQESFILDQALIGLQNISEVTRVLGVREDLPKKIDDSFRDAIPKFVPIANYKTYDELPIAVVFAANGRYEQFINANFDGEDNAAKKIFGELVGQVPLLPRVREDIAIALVQRARAVTILAQPWLSGDGYKMYHFPTRIPNLFASYLFHEPNIEPRTPSPGLLVVPPQFRVVDLLS